MGASDQHLLRDRDRDVPPGSCAAHFHAVYGEHEATIVIVTLAVLSGDLPARALRLVQEWAELHQRELHANWESARAHAPLSSIEPLP